MLPCSWSVRFHIRRDRLFPSRYIRPSISIRNAASGVRENVPVKLPSTPTIASASFSHPSTASPGSPADFRMPERIVPPNSPRICSMRFSRAFR